MKFLKRFDANLLLISAVFFLMPFVVAGEGAKKGNFTVTDDKLGPCLIQVAVPEEWNKDILIFAHGHYQEKDPLLGVLPDYLPWLKDFAKKGWIVAATSYRRNGFFPYKEAIDDIEDLRKFLVKKYGKPKRVFLIGMSMGGGILTQLSESRTSKNYNGALVFGTVVYKPTYRPKIPLLMISTQDEMKKPRAYAKESSRNKKMPSACWSVARNGHCNVRGDELVYAFGELIKWSEGEGIELERDATMDGPAQKSVAEFADGAAMAPITGVSEIYGVLDTAFVKEDLDKLGIAENGTVLLCGKKKEVKAVLGKKSWGLGKGKWVAYLDNNHLRVAYGGSDACKALGISVSDKLTIKAEETKAAK